MTTISIRVDETLKKNFDTLCDQFGLSNSAALNLFMKAVVRERKIPFEIKADSENEVRQKGWDAFLRMRELALEQGAGDYALEDVNELIGEVRNGR
ncbi:MAG: type II toxin-antitoxin system RelB/DinJ family antitoxin [Bacteroidales bacterium]|jgi:addiction module RelB/DinJ family antitoxin|nr:type II toxin-antitoxin system RelB/DinJ family antitoxin [Bacteroidales bacterium]MBR5054752.1 type II toxin-antitoxin system RelB/DinJ family antitoxin [Bacteroidales bacterium]